MSRPHTPPPPPSTESDPPPIEARLVEPGASEPAGRRRHANLLHSRAAVLAALFLGTGALGIPLLWISGKFSRFERIAWSLIAILYTLAMIAILVIAVRWMVDRLLPVF